MVAHYPVLLTEAGIFGYFLAPFEGKKKLKIFKIVKTCREKDPQVFTIAKK